MKNLKNLWNSVLGRVALATALLSGFLLFAGAPGARANYWDDCNRRLAYSDSRLHQAIAYYGYYSPEADYWRHERYEAWVRRERYRHHEWNEWREREWREREWREHEWREHHRYYRDWDDDDRD